MSQSTKRQVYPRTFRSSVLVNEPQCLDKVAMYLIPPDNALEIEQLYCHFRFTFDSGVAVGDRIIKSIGVCNEVVANIALDPSYHKKYTLNQAADGSRKVDIRLDLTPLLKRDNVGFREFYNDPATDDFTYVLVELSENLRETGTVGTIDLWKLDGLFTTKGIR